MIRNYCTQVLTGAFALLALAGACLATEATPASATTADIADAADVERFVDGVMRAQMDENHIPGAAVSIVKDGAVLLAKGYGHVDPNGSTPVDPTDTLFRVASISKLFTWTAVMQLVEAGRIDLDADVNGYLKDFKIPATYPQPITLRHLMTHTAGFEDAVLGYGEYLYGENRLESADPATVTRDQFVPAKIALGGHVPKRVRPPGEMMAYSNYGAALAGLIVEQVSGEPFADYVRQHIFEPLGMPHSTFEEPPPAHLRAHLIPGFGRSDGVSEPHPFLFFGAFGPQGAAATSAADMAHFMLAHLQSGQYLERRILSADSVAQMHAPSFRLDQRFPAMSLGFFGLRFGDVQAIGHGGDTPGYNSILVLAPGQNLGIFVTYASDGGAGAREAFVRAFFDRYYPASSPATASAETQATTADTSKYAGRYLPTRRNQSTIEKFFSLVQQASVSQLPNGNLLVAAGGDEPWQFAPTGNGVFKQVQGNYQLAFREDDVGAVTHMFFDFLPIPAMERAAWYESGGFWQPILLLSAILFVTTLLGIYFRWREVRAMPSHQRRAVYVGGITVLWLFVYLLVMVVVIAASGNNFFLRLPAAFKALLVMPLIFVLLTAALSWSAVSCWRSGYWSWGRRLHYTATALAAVLVCLFFYQWNMLGWQY